MSFFVELWESVFQPGTNPALMKATHGSFVLLIGSLIALIFMTRSIHFVNLLVIAIFLYVTVIWFVSELDKAKLESNEKLKEEAEKEAVTPITATATTTGAATKVNSPAKKSKKV